MPPCKKAPAVPCDTLGCAMPKWHRCRAIARTRTRHAQGKSAPLGHPQSDCPHQVVVAPAGDQAGFGRQNSMSTTHMVQGSKTAATHTLRSALPSAACVLGHEPHSRQQHHAPIQWCGNAKAAPHEGEGPTRAQRPKRLRKLPFSGTRADFESTGCLGPVEDTRLHLPTP